MRRQRPQSGKAKRASRRQAATLAEVLMSIMILSIGIISLATLFPISVLRSLQATQLTNATILRYNAETQIEVTPGLVFDPDESGIGHADSNYVVDPIGFALASADSAVDETMLGSLRRFQGGSRFDTTTVGADTALANARRFAASPDSWLDFAQENLESSISLSAGDTQIDLSATNIDLSDVSTDINASPPTIQARIVLVSVDGRSSHVRPIDTITSPANPTVVWLAALPAAFDVGSVRIELQETRYTWLLTVRNNESGVANVDVVVFFRRPDPPAGETSYTAEFTKDSRSASIKGVTNDTALKKGGFVLDATNALWYRVQNFTKTGPVAELTLDRPAVDDGASAVVMEGVVEVYPLGQKLPQ